MTMSSSPLKQLAVRVLRDLVDIRRVDHFMAALTADVTWTIPGFWPGISGVKNRREIEHFMRKVFPAGFPQGLRAQVRTIHQDGSTVLVEFRGIATTSRCRSYDNAYCFVFEFEGDKVVEIREYMDTLYAQAVLHT
jgi:hypothetical protein